MIMIACCSSLVALVHQQYQNFSKSLSLARGRLRFGCNKSKYSSGYSESRIITRRLKCLFMTTDHSTPVTSPIERVLLWRRLKSTSDVFSYDVEASKQQSSWLLASVALVGTNLNRDSSQSADLTRCPDEVSAHVHAQTGVRTKRHNLDRPSAMTCDFFVCVLS